MTEYKIAGSTGWICLQQNPGKQGNDYLMGGEGNDIYQFAAGDGLDMINNLSSNASDQDVLQLENISNSCYAPSKICHALEHEHRAV